jgi:NAD(P)-dependent dehydrogenase (short-subunit alcohol dehydrogenase family)
VKTRQKQRELIEKGSLAQMPTSMPPGRPGYPDDLAKAVLFLASDMASYVSGTSLLVDGAQTLR